jgi:predicted  nucleic acid-binding Zn-ribbon protein
MTFATAVNARGQSDNNEPPMIQVIKDRAVIETRQMSYDEFEAFKQLHAFEEKFEEMEAPMEDIEDQMEHQANKIEMAVEAILERAFTGDNTDNFSYDKDTAMDELRNLASQLKPKVNKIRAIAKNLETAVEKFEQLMVDSYDEDSFDTIKIIDGDDKTTFRFGHDDEAFGRDADFDY